MTRRCIVTGCEGDASARRHLCHAHWLALPGRDRSRLSLQTGFKASPIAEEAWRKARLKLESVKRSNA